MVHLKSVGTLLKFSRFIVRDFEYDPKAIETEREEKHKLDLQLKKQFVSTIQPALSCHV